MLSRFRQFAEPAIRRVLHFYWRFARGMTLGVRGIVLDAQGRVFLIRHSYVPGWHLPGGGVETGETMILALTRELEEEGKIVFTAPPPLFAIYFNLHVSRRDHVALYVIRDFKQTETPKPNREIVESGFFPFDSLPDGTTQGTRRRIAEVTSGSPPSPYW
ncbi:hypothetical protein GJW-30_1_01457 [Variibacter gotjawalensis]|uniref:Nudix hydrolase domain-containing protein n=1 Tax=Variibacter gotjawalensis TaxID=1333996 RepID=A0A0S3PSJ9_9BRAD|nr:NUDIX domain-containing protein [Variibacter gotjawalensis]NIK49242.1 8-oxo-dGTP pyrophosphatase MutT (NUDIX family) [Variibacter gotjawalensis]RZS51094.1 ADP-ribose pyrophosphatase YjhB (NUDIX family) [Variibacter gotjawalensis]BAT58929.1 hypothetical protein GJW-30_1_01457 [Variibacter gotjawalensis]